MSECATPLPDSKYYLKDQSEQLIPQAWKALIEHSQDRLFLIEVACSTDSALAKEAMRKGLKAERLSIWNGHDLSTGEGVRKTIKTLEQKKPFFVGSPPNVERSVRCKTAINGRKNKWNN